MCGTRLRHSFAAPQTRLRHSFAPLKTACGTLLVASQSAGGTPKNACDACDACDAVSRNGGWRRGAASRQKLEKPCLPRALRLLLDSQNCGTIEHCACSWNPACREHCVCCEPQRRLAVRRGAARRLDKKRASRTFAASGQKSTSDWNSRFRGPRARGPDSHRSDGDGVHGGPGCGDGVHGVGWPKRR